MKQDTKNELLNDDAFAQTIGKEIIKHYFDRNFGSLSKSDLETLLFHLYVVKFSKQDDYTISKELGITQSRIRALKERSALRYGQNYDYKKGLIEAIGNAYYDNKSNKIQCLVNDVNVLIEVRHLLESKHCFDEYSFRRNIRKDINFRFL